MVTVASKINTQKLSFTAIKNMNNIKKWKKKTDAHDKLYQTLQL